MRLCQPIKAPGNCNSLHGWLAFPLSVSWPFVPGSRARSSTRPWPTLYLIRFPLFPVAQLLPCVWGTALEPSQREAPSKVRWLQDPQLQVELELSQPRPHPNRSGGLGGYKGRAQHQGQGLTPKIAREAMSEGDGGWRPGSLPVVVTDWWGHTAAHANNRPRYTLRLMGSSQQSLTDTGAQVHPYGSGDGGLER